MNDTDRDPTDTEVEANIDALVAARWRRGWSEAQCERFAQLLTVPCPRPPYGCNARPGQECVSLHGGAPLGRQIGHVARAHAAGVSLGPPTTDLERAGTPRKASPDYRARRHWETTGEDLPGYHRGRRWSPTGSDTDR